MAVGLIAHLFAEVRKKNEMKSEPWFAKSEVSKQNNMSNNQENKHRMLLKLKIIFIQQKNVKKRRWYE